MIIEHSKPDQGQTKVITRWYSEDCDVGRTIEIWSPALTDDEAEQLKRDRSFYDGPGRAFSDAHVKQTKRRTAIISRHGLDI